jgi:translation initiation factor RLI1
MQCPRCHQRNTDTTKFCEECGNKLLRTCPACGHEVSPTAKFCSDCGEPLIRQSQVQSLKPKEEVRQIIDPALKLMMDAVHRYEKEMDYLKKAWDSAQTGRGQIVGVVGKPGVGKSRLFHEFVGAHSRAPFLVLETFSVSHSKAYAYPPLIELLKNYFRLALQDDERSRREKITGRVLTLDRSLEDTLPYLFALLGIV